VDRLWNSVTYEEVNLHAYDTVNDVKRGLERYVTLYNQNRLHLSLDDKTPDEFYFMNLPALPKTA
jgi:putative transposase